MSLYMKLFLKMFSKLANSEDPDQTALFAYHVIL